VKEIDGIYPTPIFAAWAISVLAYRREGGSRSGKKPAARPELDRSQGPVLWADFYDTT
jgi:hypothetical protein